MFRFVLFYGLIFFSLFADGKIRLAITFDDLPRVKGDSMEQALWAHQRIMGVLREEELPEMIGFANGLRAKSEKEKSILLDWINIGHVLGNHTYSHKGVVDSTEIEFINDYRRNHKVLGQVTMGQFFKLFRYPYLQEGENREKREYIRQALIKDKYQIIPVTVDFSDWRWEKPYERCRKSNDQVSIEWLKKTYLERAVIKLRQSSKFMKVRFGRDIPHILLLHFDEFTALNLKSLLQQYKQWGVEFVSVNQAMRDAFYQFDPNIPSFKGLTLLEQWEKKFAPFSNAKNKAYEQLKKKLKSICR